MSIELPKNRNFNPSHAEDGDIVVVIMSREIELQQNKKLYLRTNI